MPDSSWHLTQLLKPSATVLSYWPSQITCRTAFRSTFRENTFVAHTSCAGPHACGASSRACGKVSSHRHGRNARGGKMSNAFSDPGLSETRLHERCSIDGIGRWPVIQSGDWRCGSLRSCVPIWRQKASTKQYVANSTALYCVDSRLETHRSHTRHYFYLSFS
ncbi:hypothetical protein Poly51_49540 [Rubripirellula tenax]|uniref:Uncharacterized protein n=1 Tax=Rubripirellula tenax TaxID=2528015 RepID=A0A5C6EHQ2_9BACT|nr:hypothetical protein Poly51_49540 [Rubripirellula tenax]